MGKSYIVNKSYDHPLGFETDLMNRYDLCHPAYELWSRLDSVILFLSSEMAEYG